MLKRKNPDYQEFSQSGPVGPSAKRQTLGDITNNLFSDPKCTIVPRSPEKVIKRVIAKEDVYQFQPPNIKEIIIPSPKQEDNVFSPMLISPPPSVITTDTDVSTVESSETQKPVKEDNEATQSLTQEEKEIPEDEICEIDREEKSNPLYAWEYAGHIHTYMLRQEVRHKPTPYLTRHTQLTLSMRHILVDWMVELQESFELYHETLYLAVRLIDRFLAKSRGIEKDRLQLLSATCVLIACKYEEVKTPLLDEFIYICADAFERNEFIEMEKEVCKQLDYDINTPVAYRFLRRYHKASKQSMELHTLARYISELCLLDYSIAIELPSQVAMACLYVALRMNSLPWTEEIQLVTGAKVKDILSLAERVNSILLKAYHSNNNFNVKSKYAHEVFFQVALKRPMVTMTTTKEC